MKEVTFINKTIDSSEVSRSTPDERKRINERNREHRSHRRNTTIKKPHEVRNGVQMTSEEGTKLSSSRNTLAANSSPPASGMTRNDTEPADSSQFRCPLTGITIGGLGDPFDTFSIPMIAEDWQLIQFYRDVYYKRLWTTVSAILGTALDQLNLSRCSPEVVINECLRIPSRMWSLLASASCNLQHSTNTKDRSLLLVESGTASLRNDLQNLELDRHSLLTSIHLHLAASSLNQDRIAEAHLKGARAILKELINRGVVIPPPTLGVAALVDGQLASRMLEAKTYEEDEETAAGSSSIQKRLLPAPVT